MTTRKNPTKPLTPQSNLKTNMPIISRQSTKKVVYSKAVGKTNGSILNFFKKVHSPFKDETTLFLSQGSSTTQHDYQDCVRLPSPDYFGAGEEDLYGESDDPDGRYNEYTGSVKRQKLSNESETEYHASRETSDGDMAPVSVPALGSTGNIHQKESEPRIRAGCTSPTPIPKLRATKLKIRKIGGFLDDSESEEERVESCSTDLDVESQLATMDERSIGPYSFTQQSAKADRVTETWFDGRDETIMCLAAVSKSEAALLCSRDNNSVYSAEQLPAGLVCKEAPDSPRQSVSPHLEKGGTSFDYLDGFDDLGDFLDDEFAYGEEFAERKWMEEQARLEVAENSFADGYPGNNFAEDDIERENLHEDVTESCPICEAKLHGLTSDQASKHVNACLDGNPTSIPTSMGAKVTKSKIILSGPGSRFSRAAIAKPGQANPFHFGDAGTAQSSAFSKLMSSHAEDVAWANAAAAEQAARGKPAHQRTCPFYKIMPGFFICVDAFRYGAVQGCNAYFLSHFHSDHYVGLTSTWSHGPIYCSKVTANLVKQQLRVDPKWVVPLEFEIKVEVPGTQGVAVTMIPANHCPGSSLFLFEKVVGKGSNPKVQRILHCGDFRACPAHIAHPLLMPDVVDSLTGMTKQQKIDVCYLDTTYLNPRYSFPTQEDVIKACADICVSLKKERAEEDDAWEIVKKERAGLGMAKFFDTTIKSDSISMDAGSTRPRGRLLVICGTYSIGKERICLGIARALDCKIWAPPGKQLVCTALEDPELMSRMTDDPREAQIHMQMLMEIRAETLQDYLNGFKPHFSRVVGFRPSGWNYRPPNSRFVESPAVQTVLMNDNWKSRYTMADLVPQRGSTYEASCFGVPYSEHSSFRELTMFCCALRIEKIIPTVNVGSGASRAKMKVWIERWMNERKKNGVIRIGEGDGEVRW